MRVEPIDQIFFLSSAVSASVTPIGWEDAIKGKRIFSCSIIENSLSVIKSLKLIQKYLRFEF